MGERMAESIEKKPDDAGHIVFLAVIAIVTGVYLWDVVSVSTHINNVILIMPLACLILALASVLLISSIVARSRRGGSLVGLDDEPRIASQSRADVRRALVLLGGLGAYTWLYEMIGLDVATFLFIVGAMPLLGIRGRVFVPAFAAIFTGIVVGGADLLLHYPMFTAILP